MFSYFGGSQETPKPDLEQQRSSDIQIGEPLPDGLAAIDASEKASLIAQIEQNKYVRRAGVWHFRNDFGPKEFFIRSMLLFGLWVLAYLANPGTPRGREDKQWLQMFAIVMIIWYAIIHALAYLPSAIFGGFTDLMSACTYRVAYARENWRDYHYCAAIIVMIVILYPFIVFFQVIYDGFNPYDELTYNELRLEGGLMADICYVFRIVLHIFLLITTIYLALMLLTKYVIRVRQSYPGQYVWVAQKMLRMPYGSLFFQNGEQFDCGICLSGIWKGSFVVNLTCGNDTHVYHVDCLRDQVATHGNKYCVLCASPLLCKNPPPPEQTDE